MFVIVDTPYKISQFPYQRNLIQLNMGDLESKSLKILKVSSSHPSPCNTSCKTKHM